MSYHDDVSNFEVFRFGYTLIATVLIAYGFLESTRLFFVEDNFTIYRLGDHFLALAICSGVHITILSVLYFQITLRFIFGLIGAIFSLIGRFFDWLWGN